ncbi:flagellar hook-basal body complex protein FliE [Alkalihalobacillus sp. BA299]|uniref:flagellar hook-basal body complex protein FliE n=1 Tax=Alkalihalobacillus sp. BA299 TaxID=2815938 RepID=UPI001FFDF5ED|nr:flagellar hook-basal body complex protein FliE [Alkalihalobacillus sp. BA299]
MNKITSPFAVRKEPFETQMVKRTPAEAQNQFKTALSDAIKNVNKIQNESSEATLRLARGEAENLHDVMILGQKASITLQATVEVRNKVIEAYQEIMRMQV